MKLSFSYLSIFIFLMSYALFSCKVESKKNLVDSNSSSTEPPSAVDLAQQNDEKINPDEAIIEIKVIETYQTSGESKYKVKVLRLNQKGFGFSRNINPDDLLKLDVNSNIALSVGQEIKCVVSEALMINEQIPTFKLIRIF